MEESSIKVGKIKEIKDKRITILATISKRKRILEEIGYNIDEDGFVVDKNTGERVITEEGKEINIRRDESFGIVGGSLKFIKNIVGYSKILTEKGIVKVELKKQE
jgi:hypothetical protein